MTKLVVSTSGRVSVKRAQSFALCAAEDRDVALPKLLNAFLNWPETKRAFMSAQDTEHSFPSLVKKLSVFLTREGWENEVFELRGYKKPIDDTASNRVFNTYTENDSDAVSHAVVCVRRLVLDPCKLRLGSTYDLPWNYPAARLAEFWKEKQDVTHLLKLTPKDVQSLLQASKHSINKYMAMQ